SYSKSNRLPCILDSSKQHGGSGIEVHYVFQCHTNIKDIDSEPLALRDSETLEWNHSHFIMFDNGEMKVYLSDSQRSQFVQAAVDDPNHCMLESEESQSALLKLAVVWNCLDGAKKIIDGKRQRDKDTLARQSVQHDQADNVVIVQPNVVTNADYYPDLFELALKQKKPTFVDYFLRLHVDPRTSCLKSGILKWYNEQPPRTFKELNNVYFEWIGSFMEELYVTNTKKRHKTLRRAVNDLSDACSSLRKKFFTCHPHDTVDYTELGKILNHGNELTSNHEETEISEWINHRQEKYTEEQMLRDLFLWALFTTEIELAKVFMLHLKPRLCAALIATRIYKHFAEKASNAFSKEKLIEQALEFELYATSCVETCYAYNEKLTCELLIREVPLFGNVTCMQVAVAAECAKFFATPCVDELLNQIWYDKLAMANVNVSAKPIILVNLITLGFLAPCWVSYRKREVETQYVSIDELCSKMIAVDKEKANDKWNEFEQAATYTFAKSKAEKEKPPEISPGDGTVMRLALNELKLKTITVILSYVFRNEQAAEEIVDTNQSNMNETLKVMQFELQKLNTSTTTAPTPKVTPDVYSNGSCVPSETLNDIRESIRALNEKVGNLFSEIEKLSEKVQQKNVETESNDR
ncbi:unnamed protein product, partial [Didymodactylos carnosus]